MPKTSRVQPVTQVASSLACLSVLLVGCGGGEPTVKKPDNPVPLSGAEGTDVPESSDTAPFTPPVDPD